jgi:hypothetical protein
MTGEHFRMRLLDDRKSLIDGACDNKMQFLSASLEQRFVGSVADQRMFELIGGVRDNPVQVKHFCIGQIEQRVLEILFRDWKNRAQQIVGKFAADYGADLDNFLGRPQPVAASPIIVTTWPSPSRTRSQRFISRPSSSSRPINGVMPRTAAAAARCPRTPLGRITR